MRSSRLTGFRTFASYLMVGGFVGLLGIAIREVVGVLLPADTPTWYTVSVAISFAAQILLAFSLHRHITFAGALEGRKTVGALYKFSIVAVVGVVTVSLLAPAIRYGLGFDLLFGARGGLIAFALAALLVALPSFFLNQLFTFKREQRL